MLKKLFIIALSLSSLSMNAAQMSPSGHQQEKQVESVKELLQELQKIENPDKTIICIPIDYLLTQDKEKSEKLEAEIAGITNPSPEQGFAIISKMITNLTLVEPELAALLTEAQAKKLHFLFYSLLPIEFLGIIVEHIKSLGIDLASLRLTTKAISLSIQDKKLALYKDGLLAISTPDIKIIQYAINNVKEHTANKFDEVLFLQ